MRLTFFALVVLLCSSVFAMEKPSPTKEFLCNRGDDAFSLRVVKAKPRSASQVSIKHQKDKDFVLLNKVPGTRAAFKIAELSGFYFWISLSPEVLSGKSGVVYSFVNEGLHQENFRNYCVVTE